MIRMIAVFVGGVVFGFVGSIAYSIVELARKVQP